MRGAEGIPVVLTIAGSDSGGGAGIQADLKTFQALGVFGTSAITCLTAQNPDEVRAILAVKPAMVEAQIRTVCDGFPVAAAKTGMLYSAPIIRAVARAVRDCGIPVLVVDPVMVSTSGSRLLREDAVAALGDELLPFATVVTPNAPEAEILWGRAIRSVEDMGRAARGIGRRFGVACVAKGGHVGGDAPGGDVVDTLYEGGRIREFRSKRVAARETHGTGCTFSAALAALLARGLTLAEAVPEAKRFVSLALARAAPAGRHVPLAIRAAFTRPFGPRPKGG